MPRYICTTCGVQYADSHEPPATCKICEDDRQYLLRTGQNWTTHEELLKDHTITTGIDDGVFALNVSPSFAINQRSVLVESRAGNILWECLSLVTEQAVVEIDQRGGVEAIAISHPHFFASMTEWSDALGGIPILIHAEDRRWVLCEENNRFEFWSGKQLSLNSDITLVHCPGHFPGSTVLHWKSGAVGGALLTGDSIQVAHDRRQASVMHSYPNAVPVRPRVLDEIQDRLAPYDFQNAYGFSWGRNIIGGAKEAVTASLRRYLEIVNS